MAQRLSHTNDPTGSPSADRIDLSVIMVTWNALHLTEQALTSLREQTSGITYEVILIDNGTTKDDTVREIPKRFPWVRFEAISPNRGFAYPNNLGTCMARGRYIVLLNNDTIQIENALGKSVEYMDRHPTVGALGITHRNNDRERSLQRSYHQFPKPLQEILVLLGLRSPHVASFGAGDLVEKDVDWVVGSYLFMRRECVDDVGMLDERFFLYDEDIDWCFRARAKGWPVRFWPGAELVHLGNGTMSWMKDKTFMHYRSHLTYLAKNHSRAAAAGYYLSLSARLTGSLVWQAAKLVGGRGSAADLRARFNRQMSFLRLAATRTGN